MMNLKEMWILQCQNSCYDLLITYFASFEFLNETHWTPQFNTVHWGRHSTARRAGLVLGIERTVIARWRLCLFRLVARNRKV